MFVNRELPQDSDRLFVTDGGLETTLVFHEGIDLPEFAAFVLLKDEQGPDTLKRYFREYMSIAKEVDAPLILETVTWRANPDWASKLGYSPEELDDVNRRSVALIKALRPEFESSGNPLIISGCIGPRGDGYVAGEQMGPEQASHYHSRQVGVFLEAGADLVTAITMTYENEAIGIVNAAARAGIPSVISFTVETDGRLPNGSTLEEAITRVDEAADVPPAYFMINCAHPSHFVPVLGQGGEWLKRVRGTRVNASSMSHEELDNSEELDEGDPLELADAHAAIAECLPRLNVVGGCCGTDERHVRAIARSVAARLRQLADS